MLKINTLTKNTIFIIITIFTGFTRIIRFTKIKLFNPLDNVVQVLKLVTNGEPR